MNTLLSCCFIFLMIYSTAADIYDGFTLLGRSGSKTFFMSNTNVKRSYNEASNACKTNKMVLARLETKTEFDDLIEIFGSNVQLPDRAYVGISLLNSHIVDNESKNKIPYSVTYFPGNPSGDGTCLEVLRERGYTGINDLACSALRHFICEKEDVSTSESFTFLGRSESKQFYISNTNVKSSYNEASNACKTNNMVLARLETKTEFDDLIEIFGSNVQLPDRAYVGISLLNSHIVDNESKNKIPYSVTYFPGNPSGDGTCLEVLRERGYTGINDLACSALRHFICEKEDVSTSESFTFLGRSESKQFYISNTNVKSSYNEASNACKTNNMVLARLETKTEFDDLIEIFGSNVQLPDRAYVGISLLNSHIVDNESKNKIPYSVTYFPGNPSGDGTCLEVLRERGYTGINDLACSALRHFICEKEDVSTSESFTFLGRSESKQFYISNTNVKSSYNEASNACKTNNMVLARLETKTEFDDLIEIFGSNVQLPDRAYVGISLLNSHIVDNESKNKIPYSVTYFPGNPSGDGTCLEVLRERGYTGINDLACSALRHFICEKEDVSTSESFTFLGRSESKQFYISNTNVKSSYNEASNACKTNNMVLARLETKTEFDDLIEIFGSNVQLPDRAYVGISLLNSHIVDNESKNKIPYSVTYFPGNPSGDGTCLEVLRERGYTGINDLACSALRHFICEKEDVSTSESFTFLGRSESKQFYISNTNVKSSYNEASNACKTNNMVLARLETKTEFDDLIEIFGSNVQLPDRAYVGISLLNSHIVDNESKNKIPYSVTYFPGNPSGDGTCLEVLRERGYTGINDLACSALRHFICEKEDVSTSESFTFLGRSESKQFYISNTNVKSSYNEASNACKTNNMVLARLETKTEFDDLIEIFGSNVQLPDRAYVGISLLNSHIVDNESKNKIPYSVTYFPGNPSGDGTCLELLRERGYTGINDLACSHIRHFICEKKETKTTISTTQSPIMSTSPTVTTTPITPTQSPLSLTSQQTTENLNNKNFSINANYGTFDLITSTVTFRNPKTGKVQTKEATIDLNTGQVNQKNGEVDNDFAGITSLRVVNKKIDPRTGNVIISLIELSDILIDPKWGQMWVRDGSDPVSGNTIYTSSQVDTRTRFIVTWYGFYNPETENIDIVTSIGVGSKIAKADSVSGQILTATGEIDMYSGQPVYSISQIDCESGDTCVVCECFQTRHND